MGAKEPKTYICIYTWPCDTNIFTFVFTCMFAYLF